MDRLGSLAWRGESLPIFVALTPHMGEEAQERALTDHRCLFEHPLDISVGTALKARTESLTLHDEIFA